MVSLYVAQPAALQRPAMLPPGAALVLSLQFTAVVQTAAGGYGSADGRGRTAAGVTLIDVMKPDGLLFAGHSESFLQVTKAWSLRGKTVYEVAPELRARMGARGSNSANARRRNRPPMPCAATAAWPAA